MNTFDMILGLFDSKKVKAGGLQMGLSEAISDRVAEFSNLVQKSLKKVYLRGLGEVEAEAHALMAAFDRLAKEVGRDAEELELGVLGLLNDSYRELIAICVKALPQSLVVDERTYTIEKVKIASKMSLSGSVHAALTEFLTITGSGAFTTTATYSERPKPV
jgi:hypothetical protein